MNRKLTFAFADAPNPLPTGTIVELCDYLTDRVLVPRFDESGAKWEHEFMDFFSYDNSCDPLQPTGTMIFVVPPLFAGCVASLRAAIVDELARLGIRTGTIALGEHPRRAGVSALWIPVVENPTAQLQPPEVNMSRTRGLVVLRDVLGYQAVNGRYEFDAQELLGRVEAIDEARIAASTASPVREARAEGKVSRLPSAVSVRAVHRCLEEIREFAAWALEHDHRRLVAA